MRISHPVKTEATIARRAQAFLKSTETYAPSVAALLGDLKALGEVYLFGGLLRDAAQFGLENFRSDIDLVVASDRSDRLETTLRKYRPARTAFGGYRLHVDSVQIDVWSLKSTWAFRSGLVRGSTVQDLLHTTFFNWDSIAMSLDSCRLYRRDNYLDELRSNFLDIVLRENPNPIGMVHRTIKHLARTSACMSPQLGKFVLEAISSAQASDLFAWIRTTAIAPVLKESLASDPTKPIYMAWQLDFWRGSDRSVWPHPSRTQPSPRKASRQ
jgi:hypothetical protein